MPTRGEEFIKNLKAKQEKEELEKRLKELNALEKSSKSIDETALLEEEIVDLPAQELGDILLSDENEPVDKKKYIILGIALIVLFVITIIVIRLISSPQEKKEIIKEPAKVVKEEQSTTPKTDIEKQYQEILNKKLQEVEEATKVETKALEEDLDLEKIQKYEQPITPPKQPKKEVKKEAKSDIFGIEKETKPKKQEIKKQEIKKQEIKKAPKKQVSNIAKPKGYYIQIGAFSKPPSKKILDNITRYGFSYTLYKVKVKNKTFTKVLVGSYNSRKSALKDMRMVKKLLKAPGAFIVHFK